MAAALWQLTLAHGFLKARHAASTLSTASSERSLNLSCIFSRAAMTLPGLSSPHSVTYDVTEEV